MLNDIKDRAQALLGKGPLAKGPVPAELKYFFGTPDGTVKWADWDEMEKELGPFQSGNGANLIYPNGRRSGLRN